MAKIIEAQDRFTSSNGTRWRRPPAPVSARTRRVLDVLTRAATEGARCPTNPEIGKMLGIETHTVARDIQSLVAAGMICSEKRANIFRRVTIEGVGATEWGGTRRKHDPDGDDFDMPIREPEGAADVFKAARFDDGPDTDRHGRAPQPLTLIETRVAGPWA